MSIQLGKVIHLILEERFGPVVAKVGLFLFQFGTNPLLYIKRNTELPLSKIKEALCVLIKFRLVTYKPNKNEEIANYTLNRENILLMQRYPKYLNLIKRKFGDISEMLLEELLERSYWTASELILKVAERIKDSQDTSVTLSGIRDQFLALVTSKYINRLPTPKDDDRAVPIFINDEKDIYVMPNLDLRILNQIQNNSLDISKAGDSNIYWTANFDRFHQDIRDKLIVDSFTRKFDENAGEFVKLLLERMYIRTEPWADVSNPVPVIEIKDLLRKKVTHPNLLTFFDQYANILEQDSNYLIRKSGEASGGSFQIYIKDIYTQLCWELIEQVIVEKFDSKAARIFRLVKMKRYIEPDQIQQLAMIPGKETKRLSYKLLEENFLKLQDLKKSSSNNAPTKSFTLFYIDLESIVRMLVELCYKTIYNGMTRKKYERLVNKRIIDKKQRVDTISMGMRAQGATEEQLVDIEDMITPPEKEILKKIDRQMNKFNMQELEVDDTLFILQMYIKYLK